MTAGTRLDTLTRSVDLVSDARSIWPASAAATHQPTPAAAWRRRCAGEKIDEEPSFAESLVPLIHYGWSDLRTVRDGRWKYILAPRPELYDLDRDPGEPNEPGGRRNRRSARALRARPRAAAAAEQQAATSDAAASVPPDLLEKLGALGYVSPGGPTETKASGADPKDKLEDYKVLNTLMQPGAHRPARGAAGGNGRRLAA